MAARSGFFGNFTEGQSRESSEHRHGPDESRSVCSHIIERTPAGDDRRMYITDGNSVGAIRRTLGAGKEIERGTVRISMKKLAQQSCWWRQEEWLFLENKKVLDRGRQTKNGNCFCLRTTWSDSFLT
jgi:hypothetical protein